MIVEDMVDIVLFFTWVMVAIFAMIMFLMK